jgi:hypothetical protein
LGQRERLINKSFLVLFLKKELLPFCSQPHRWSQSGTPIFCSSVLTARTVCKGFVGQTGRNTAQRTRARSRISPRTNRF